MAPSILFSKLARRDFLRKVALASGAAFLAPRGGLAGNPLPDDSPATLYVVPNTHGTIGGWLCDFNTERNYVLNNYLAHLDRVSRDPTYSFVYSEVPNLLTFLQFAPDRLGELKQRIAERRVELCNAFFLESTVSLSGGEALVQLGVQGLRWYDAVFGFRPRFAWLIDVIGNHRQMPQIVAGLGLEAMVFCRNNPATKSAFWWVAPDETRMLTICDPLGYAALHEMFRAQDPNSPTALEGVEKNFEWNRKHSPSGKTFLALAGSGDYSLPPAVETWPEAFTKKWNRTHPDSQIRFGILADYVDALKAEITSGETHLEEYRGDTAYCFNAMWFDMPGVKQAFRRTEHLLQAAEMVATSASLLTKSGYPSQDLYDAWINLLMNMDRNTLWGSAAGVVFRDAESWDAEDRFLAAEQKALGVADIALKALGGEGQDLVLFNPLNWRRTGPVELAVPKGKTILSENCEASLSDSMRVFCDVDMPPLGWSALKTKDGKLPAPAPVEFKEEIETEHYRARIDRRTGALTSLRLKPSHQEVLGAAGNVVTMESVAGILKREDPGNFMLPRTLRRIVDSSDRYECTIRAYRGPLATTVVASSELQNGSKLKRTARFFHAFPRIDFDTELDLRTPEVLVTANFTLGAEVSQRTRGIPFGFSTIDPQLPFRPPLREYEAGEMEDHGFSDSILPAVRWSHYRMTNGMGIAMLDRGLTGHELNARTVTIGLVNAHSRYMGLPNELLGGQGVQSFSYALIAHTGAWQDAMIPLRAWEFNAPLLARSGSLARKVASLMTTSGNLIVEAVRRDGRHIEVRLCEWQGRGGEAEVTLNLPHDNATLTDLMGEKASPLTSGPPYRFPIRPQQIVTLRFETKESAPVPRIVRHWHQLVPRHKQEGLLRRINSKGHPPRGPKDR